MTDWPAAGDPARRLGRPVFTAARRTGSVATRLRYRARRRRLLWGLRLRALWLRAEVRCDVASSVRFARRVRIEVEEHSRSELKVGANSGFGEDTVISLRGGTLAVGEWVEVRPRCTFEVAGHLELVGPGLVQHGTSLHCDERVVVGTRTVLSEYVTIVDSSHGTDESGAWFVDVVRTSPVEIGTEVWVGAKATVGRGVRLGDRCVVSANSLVVRDVPAGWLASGVPAEAVRRIGDSEGSGV